MAQNKKQKTTRSKNRPIYLEINYDMEAASDAYAS